MVVPLRIVIIHAVSCSVSERRPLVLVHRAGVKNDLPKLPRVVSDLDIDLYTLGFLVALLS